MKLTCAILTLGISATLCHAGGPSTPWPQFRGPGGAGVAEEQKPPITFGPDKNVKWKVPVPSGFSSPIIAGDLLVLTAFENKKLYTIAYQRSDGKEAWRKDANAKQIERFHKTEGSPASSTPVTDGRHIVSYFGSCGLICYDLTGKELWRLEMPPAKTPFNFGTGVSPILADGLVVLVRDEGNAPKILAIEVASGKLKWEKKRESKAAFCTPVIYDAPTGKQIIAAGFGRMIGYDLATGEEKWTVKGMPAATCTTPIVLDGTLYFAGWAPGEELKLPTFDELIKLAGQEKLGYITAEGLDKTFMKGFFESHDQNNDGKLTREEWSIGLKMLDGAHNSAFALKLGGSGDVTATHKIWQAKKGLPYVPSGIVYRGQFVLVKDGGLVTAYDAKSGKQLYVQERAVNAGRYYASPVAANGYIYFSSLDDGVITVLKGGEGTPTEIARNPTLKERIAATPVIAENTLYVRTAGHLYAFAEKK